MQAQAEDEDDAALRDEDYVPDDSPVNKNGKAAPASAAQPKAKVPKTLKQHASDTSQAESALSTESVKMTCTGCDSSSKEVCQLAAKADPKAKKRIAWGQNLQANS